MLSRCRLHLCSEPAQHGARAHSSLQRSLHQRPGAVLRRLRAACTRAPAPGQPSPPHNTVVVRRGEGTGRITAAHQAEARCDTPPLRSPVHAQRAAPATPSSAPARGAPLRVEEWEEQRDKGGVPTGLDSIAKPQGFAMYPFYQRCLLKLSLLLLGGPQKHFGNSGRLGPLKLGYRKDSYSKTGVQRKMLVFPKKSDYGSRSRFE